MSLPDNYLMMPGEPVVDRNWHEILTQFALRTSVSTFCPYGRSLFSFFFFKVGWVLFHHAQVSVRVWSVGRWGYVNTLKIYSISTLISRDIKLNTCLHELSCILFALVVLSPAKCNPITVCVEDDNDLRVDCLVDPKPNQINSYEFSWSTGTKESILNTNVSGSSVEGPFKGKSTVVELEPNGYRMTLSGFTDKLPHNTTYLCKLSGVVARVTVEKGREMTVWMVLGSEHESEWEKF